MRQTTISMLEPEVGVLPAYDRFYRGYSVLISTNVVTHHLVHGASESDLSTLLRETVTVAEHDYCRAATLYASMGLAFDAIQSRERRGLDLADVSLSIASGKLTARDTILAFLNFNEFLLLFALLEDAVKDLQAAADALEHFPLKENAIMTQLLKIARDAGVVGNFKAQLVLRTAFGNFEDVSKMWDYFVAMRHLYVHASGRPTVKWLKGFLDARDALLARLRAPDLMIMDIRGLIERIAPQQHRLLMLPDGFVNLFRNYAVAAMEAAYVSLASRRK